MQRSRLVMPCLPASWKAHTSPLNSDDASHSLSEPAAVWASAAAALARAAGRRLAARHGVAAGQRRAVLAEARAAAPAAK